MNYARAARLTFICACVALAACSRDGRPPQSTAPPEDTMNPTSLEITLRAQPAQLTMAERSTFKVGLTAVNRGSSTIDPKLHESVLTVNDARAYAWDLSIQNGPRDAKWSALPPAERIEIEWPLGEALFEQPGDYHLVLKLDGQESSVAVRVSP